MTVQNMIFEALKLTGAGIGSVFVALALFYFMTKVIVALFPEKQKEK